MGAGTFQHGVRAVERETHPVRPLVRAVSEGAALGSPRVADRRSPKAITGVAKDPSATDSYTGLDSGAKITADKATTPTTQTGRAMQKGKRCVSGRTSIKVRLLILGVGTTPSGAVGAVHARALALTLPAKATGAVPLAPETKEAVPRRVRVATTRLPFRDLALGREQLGRVTQLPARRWTHLKLHIHTRPPRREQRLQALHQRASLHQRVQVRVARPPVHRHLSLRR